MTLLSRVARVATGGLLGADGETDQFIDQDGTVFHDAVEVCTAVQPRLHLIKPIEILVSACSHCNPCVLFLLQAQLHAEAHEDGGLACRDAEVLEHQRK